MTNIVSNRRNQPKCALIVTFLILLSYSALSCKNVNKYLYLHLYDTFTASVTMLHSDVLFYEL